MQSVIFLAATRSARRELIPLREGSRDLSYTRDVRCIARDRDGGNMLLGLWKLSTMRFLVLYIQLFSVAEFAGAEMVLFSRCFSELEGVLSRSAEDIFHLTIESHGAPRNRINHPSSPVLRFRVHGGGETNLLFKIPGTMFNNARMID